MQLETKMKIQNEKNMMQYLKENSFWVKELNRNSTSYVDFFQAMKELYHLRDKDIISDEIENIYLIISFISAFK